MALYMDILKGAAEKLLGCPETVVYVCAFGTGLCATLVV